MTKCDSLGPLVIFHTFAKCCVLRYYYYVGIGNGFSPQRLLTTCEFLPLQVFVPPIKRYVNTRMHTTSLCVMGIPICEFFCLTLPVCVRGSVCDVSVRRQRSFLETKIHQIFSMQMHTHTLLKKSLSTIATTQQATKSSTMAMARRDTARMHMGITEIPVCIRGWHDMQFTYAYRD